jgi:hypothetical protein
LGAGSLILTPHGFLLITFLAFLEAGVSATFRLPTQVLEDPALGPFDDALAGSALGDRAETGTTIMGVSPSTPGVGTMMLSKACERVYKHEYLKMIGDRSEHCLPGSLATWRL